MKFDYRQYRINNISYNINPKADALSINDKKGLSEKAKISMNKLQISISVKSRQIIFKTRVKVNTQLNDESKTHYRSLAFDVVIDFTIKDPKDADEQAVFEASNKYVSAISFSKIQDLVRQISGIDMLTPIIIQGFDFPNELGFKLQNINGNVHGDKN